LGANYRTTALLSATAIIVYAILAEPNPPILRAAITGTLYFAARGMRRPVRRGNWLAAAVVVVLLINPSDLFDAGFQFSFAIVAALMFLLPSLTQRWLSQRTMEIGGISIPVDTPATWLTGLRKSVALILIVSLLAWLVGVPIAAYHFGRLSPFGWLNSMLMSPLAGLVMCLGFVKLCVTALWPTLGGVLGGPLHATTLLLAWLARTLAAVPGCNIDVPPPHVIWIAGYYAVLVILIRGGPPRLRNSAAVGIVPLALIFALPWLPISHATGALRIWTLAVGNGSATIIELPDGHAIAYDLGSRAVFDPAGEHHRALSASSRDSQARRGDRLTSR